MKSPWPVGTGQGIGNAIYLLLPLNGPGSAVTSFQLRPVFGAVSNRVSPGSAMSRFIGFGDKSWDNFKNYF